MNPIDPVPDGLHLDAEASFGKGGRRVRRYVLENGLTLILQRDPSAPVFSFQAWYRVGSAYEEKGHTGLAHFFEHLMFKGTERHPEGSFDRIMEQRGAQTNAGTWLDWTFYYENLPAGSRLPAGENLPAGSRLPAGENLPAGTVEVSGGEPVDRGRANLEAVAEFEADRMRNLLVEEAPFRSELEVVKNERRLRVDNDPDGRMDEALWSLAFEHHPYRWPTIGWMSDLEGMAIEDARDFYRRYYAPNRTVLVVVGDLEERVALETILRHFGPLQAEDVTRPPREVEPAQEGERSRRMTLPLATERLLMGYHVPELRHADMPAIDVLAEVLFNSDSARAEVALVHDAEIALSVSGWVGAFEDPSMMEIAVNCQQGRTADEAIAALDQVFERLLAEGVRKAEVVRARNKLRMGTLRAMLSAHSRAYQLGFYEVTAGDFRRLFTFMDTVQAVTTEDVLRVARAYLQPENRAVVVGMPAPMPGEERAGGEGAEPDEGRRA